MVWADQNLAHHEFTAQTNLPQYTSFYVIVKLPDGGHNSQPKHVIVNKLMYKYAWCCVVRKVKTDINLNVCACIGGWRVHVCV